MKRVFLAAAALVAAAVVSTVATLPRVRIRFVPQDDGTVSGVIHIHSNRSDGRSSPDEIAGAAARAGLRFIVFTDHGDATRVPDPPVYRSGVLCIDAVEISTSGGHYLALDMPAAPYPLGGEPRDVVDDVARLGGFGVPAHPDSPKPELRWREWTAPFPGMEIINPDTGWRAKAQEAGWRPKLRLVERLFSYPFRPGETIATFATASSENLARWEVLTRRRKVVALAGADAHAKLDLKSSDPGDNRFSVALPSYEASFSALSVHVRPDAPLSTPSPGSPVPGQAAADAAAILHAIRNGHLYIVVDGLASPPSFVFTAESGGQTAGEGDAVVLPGTGGPITFHVRSNAPSTFTTTVWQGNRVIETTSQPEVAVKASADPAVYRVEIRAADRPAQPVWVISNPIYVRSVEPPDRLPDRGPATHATSISEGPTATVWRVEHDPSSTAAIEATWANREETLRMQYRLAAVRSPQTYAALLTHIPDGVGSNTRLAFTAHADRPMRVSVQLRTAGSAGMPDQRWQRSVYLDTTDRDEVIDFDDLTPIGDPRTWQPALNDIRYVLFVVDTTNTKPGTAGQVWISRPALGR